jgi:hypothetical protein
MLLIFVYDPATLLNVFMSLRVFWWNFSGLPGLRSYHLQIGIIWFLPSLFKFLLLLPSVILLWIGIPVLHWIRVGRVDYLVSSLIPGFSPLLVCSDFLYPFWLTSLKICIVWHEQSYSCLLLISAFLVYIFPTFYF